MEGLPDKNCDLWWKVYPPFGGGKELVVKIIIIFFLGGRCQDSGLPTFFFFFFFFPTFFIDTINGMDTIDGQVLESKVKRGGEQTGRETEDTQHNHLHY